MVRVHGLRFLEAIGREGIWVAERYSNVSGLPFVEEPEPVVYYTEAGFLHRIHLTEQGGRFVSAIGPADSRFLPEILQEQSTWESSTVAFQVGGGLGGGLGFSVASRHVTTRERETVRVPAGSFRNCLRVDTYASYGPGSGGKPDTEIAFYYSDWYAPGVGLVRTQQWDDLEHRHERARIELLKYTITPSL